MVSCIESFGPKMLMGQAPSQHGLGVLWGTDPQTIKGCERRGRR